MHHRIHRGNISTVVARLAPGDTFTLPSTISFTEIVDLASARKLRLDAVDGNVTVSKAPYRHTPIRPSLRSFGPLALSLCSFFR